MVRDKQITVGRQGGRVGSQKALFMELSLSHPEAIVLYYKSDSGPSQWEGDINWVKEYNIAWRYC